MIEIELFSDKIRDKLSKLYDLSKYKPFIFTNERGKDKKKLNRRRIYLVVKDTCPYEKLDIEDNSLYNLISDELVSKFNYKIFKKVNYYGILVSINQDFKYKEEFYTKLKIDLGNSKMNFLFKYGLIYNKYLKSQIGKKIPMLSKKLDNGKWIIKIDFKKLKTMFEENKSFEELYS